MAGDNDANIEPLARDRFGHGTDCGDVVFLQPVAGKRIGGLQGEAGIAEGQGLGRFDPSFVGWPCELNLKVAKDLVPELEGSGIHKK